MDDLPDLTQPRANLGLGPHQRPLAQVHGVGQNAAPLFNASRVGAILQLDPFGLQETLQVFENLVSFDGFHSRVVVVGHHSP